MMMPTGTKGKRPLRHLTATDKCIAIQRIHDGESKASVARDIGVPESTLRGWCKNEEKLRYMSQQAQDQKPSADKLMDKIVSEAAMAAAAAAELLGGGPAEKRARLDPSALAALGMNGKGLKNDYLYKRNSLNGLDLTGAHHSPLNGDAYAYSYNSFAKAASNLSAMQNKQKDMKGYDLSLKSDDHGKSDLSMAAISPLTSLSNLSGMGALGQSPLALSFNDIATNLNLLAQLQSNSMASFGALNGHSAASGSNGTPVRSSRPRSNPNNHQNQFNAASCSPRSDIDKPQSLTVKNLAKLQQRSPSLSASDLGMGLGLSDSNNNNHHHHMNKAANKSSSKNPSNGNNPVEDPLWYWLKSQQAMMGMNSLYSSLPRTSSPVSARNTSSAAAPPPQASPNTPNPTVSTPQHSGQSKGQSQNSGSAPSNANFDYHLLNAMLPNSLAGLNDPKALTSSPFFWQWYKTIGANLLKGQQPGGQSSPTPPNHSSQKDPHLNYLSPTGSNKTGGSPSPYNNILFSQLTKNSGQGSDAMKSEPEDLSAHHPQQQERHHQLFNDEMDEDDEEVDRHNRQSRRPSSNGSGQGRTEEDVDELLDRNRRRRRESTSSSPNNGASHENANNHSSSGVVADLSGTTTTSGEAPNASASRTPSPSSGKCPATNVLELMNPGASPLNSLLKPISGPGSDVAPMSHSSTHSSSTNSTTMLTEAPNSPQSPRDSVHGAGEETSNDSNQNHALHHHLKSPTKVRAVLDNFLYNNINNNNNAGEDNNNLLTPPNGENAENEHNNNIDIRNNNTVVPLMSSLEAFEYGEKFLKWLEACSDPSITAMQVMQFRYLLQSVKTSANRAANNNGQSLTTTTTTTNSGVTGLDNGAVEFMAVKREVVAGMTEERSKNRRRK